MVCEQGTVNDDLLYIVTSYNIVGDIGSGQ